ncbi:hypothetical protein T459_34841 [Capsicum annuum]|uniref:Uncharacterized protein n=1 Tax=Capsicum annuum TaxID=4072 RepID=A0A2G2XUY7_CAPAN|nr:hypothetical protein T459_34841 [Capsicum annuum]
MLGGPSKKARGGWEKDETIEVTARRETIEEAGVCGDIKDERAISKKALPTGLDERSLGVVSDHDIEDGGNEIDELDLT